MEKMKAGSILQFCPEMLSKDCSFRTEKKTTGQYGKGNKGYRIVFNPFQNNKF